MINTKRNLSLLALLLLVGCAALPDCPDCPAIQCPTTTACPTCPEMPPTPTAPDATATVVATAVPTPEPSANLLINAGFEGGTYQESQDLFVPLGWAVWSSCQPGAVHSELEAHPPHVRHGNFAARVWQSYNTCAMGLYQQVDALPEATYQLVGHGFSWSTSKPIVGTPSEAWVKMWIGIDPLGGIDPTAASVVWSDENAARDIYGKFLLTVKARHTRITVFTHSKPDWALARNDSFWDDMALYEIALPPAVEATISSLPSPTVIEVTPLGGTPMPTTGEKVEDIAGTYTPKGVQNVRGCAVAGAGCPILYRLGAGLPVTVYAKVTVYPDGDVWLCLDASTNASGESIGSQCGKMVAYRIGDAVFGELVIH